MEQATIEINDRTSDRDESKPSARNGDGSRLEFVFRCGDEEFVPARTFRAIAGISHSTLLRYARKGLGKL